VVVKAGFWQQSVYLSEPSALQIRMTCPGDVYISKLPFSALQISFSDERPDVVVKHIEGDDTAEIQLGDIVASGVTKETEGSLRWLQGRNLVLSGRLLGDVEGEVYVGDLVFDLEYLLNIEKVSSVKLLLNQRNWNIQLYIVPTALVEWGTSPGSLAPLQDISPVAL
jgi:hypothetical protein